MTARQETATLGEELQRLQEGDEIAALSDGESRCLAVRVAASALGIGKPIIERRGAPVVHERRARSDTDQRGGHESAAGSHVVRFAVGVRPAVVTRGATTLVSSKIARPLATFAASRPSCAGTLGMVSSHARSPWLCSGVGLSGIDMRFIMTSSMRLSHFAEIAAPVERARRSRAPAAAA